MIVPWPEIEARLAGRGRDVRLSGHDGNVEAELDSAFAHVVVVLEPILEGGRVTLDPIAVRLGGRELAGPVVEAVAERAGYGGKGVTLPVVSGLTPIGAAGAEDGLRLDLSIASGTALLASTEARTC